MDIRVCILIFMRTVYIYLYYVICIYTHVGDICKRQITTFGFVQKYGIATTKQMLQKQKLADMSVVNWTFFFALFLVVTVPHNLLVLDLISPLNWPPLPPNLGQTHIICLLVICLLVIHYTDLYISKLYPKQNKVLGYILCRDWTSPIGLVKLTPHLEMAMAIVTHFLGATKWLPRIWTCSLALPQTQLVSCF